MSGIYIPDMEMPKSCDKCPCIDKETNPSFTVCGVNKKIIPFEWSRKPDVFEVIHPKPKHCPLIAVPDHGRLVDADALVTELEKFCKDRWVYNTVSHMPTIIPAEESTDFYTKGHLHLGYAEEGE